MRSKNRQIEDELQINFPVFNNFEEPEDTEPDEVANDDDQ